jgi:hypothetical protein
MLEILKPRARSAGISAVSSVVLPLPDQPTMPSAGAILRPDVAW